MMNPARWKKPPNARKKTWNGEKLRYGCKSIPQIHTTNLTVEKVKVLWYTNAESNNLWDGEVAVFEIPIGIDEKKIQKEINDMLSEARQNAKPEKCILCGEAQTSFCNSHSVPKMSLKAIADNGMLLHATAAIGLNMEVVHLEDGVNRSGTFNYICRKCDSSFFQDYENPNLLIAFPSDKMLAKIAVKNFLLQLSKRAVESQLIPIQQREYNLFTNPQDSLDLKKMDFNEYETELYFHKNIADQNETGGYQLLYWELLPYCVPIATQSAIALPKDMSGASINNIYDYRETIRMQYLHIGVFPLKQQSVILLFYHKRDKLYRNLRHQFNSSSKEKVLQFINYLIFAYTENFFLSPKLREEVEANRKLQMLCRENNGLPEFGLLSANNGFGLDYTPISPAEVPNFLSPDWAL